MHLKSIVVGSFVSALGFFAMGCGPEQQAMDSAGPVDPAQVSAQATSVYPFPVYNAYNSGFGDYLQSRKGGEGAPAYVALQMPTFTLYPMAYGTATTPLYRCLDGGGRHFLSVSSSCEGTYRVEGVLGYMYGSNDGSKYALYRCVGGNGSHYSTPYYWYCQSWGMSVEGIQGWVDPG